MTRAPTSPHALHTPRQVFIEDRAASAIAERMIREFELYLARSAAQIAGNFPAAHDDVVQAARIALWEVDLGRYAQRDLAYLKRILCNRMIDAFQMETRGGLTKRRSKETVS